MVENRYRILILKNSSVNSQKKKPYIHLLDLKNPTFNQGGEDDEANQ